MKMLEYPFDGMQILRKKRAIKKELLKSNNLIEKKIAILSGTTIGEIKNILELFLLNNGIKPIFFEGQYGRYYEDIIFDDKKIKEFNPDYIYIHTSNKNIDYYPSVSDSIEEIHRKFELVFNHYNKVWAKIESEYNSIIIQNNFELPNYRIMGNRDSSSSNGRINFINKLNIKFSEYAEKHSNFFINDINYLSSLYGIDNWCDMNSWYLYKYSLSVEYIPYLCNNIANIIKSLLGKNKKSLVLDLDNTLWGGVIGECGVDGIELGKDTPIGIGYLEFQEYLKEISKTGIILNICSKNEFNNAIEGFEHRSSILKQDDFTCIKANWQDKYLNILEIAKETNILLDNMVFVDDNPMERDMVKNNLNNIYIPNIGEVDSYIKFLDRSGIFEVTNFSEDDKKRNDFYKMNIQREKMKENFADFDEYLRSLEMICEICSFNNNDINRILQLINKTNQFNLTTKRYELKQIEDVIDNPNYITICARLRDKFGDNGIVSLVIGRIDNYELHIDLWVMSCRVFKRNLEFAVFDYLVELANKHKINKIKGYYYKTAKNLLTSDFYSSIGFKKIKENGEDTIWEYGITNCYKKLNNVMEVREK